jgi:putative ABC transport system permease protein
MLRLLRQVSLRDYGAARGRLALMIGGIAIGVDLIAALGVINASVLSNFRASLERAAGKAALQVVLGTGEIGFDEQLIGVVAGDRDVTHAFGMVRGTLVADDGSGEVLQLFGVDLVSEAIDSYDVVVVGEDVDELELLNDPTSVFLTEDYARRRGIRVGDRVAFAGPTGVQRLHVRRLLRAEGLATIFGGNLAVMDLPAAQRLLAKEGRVDQIDVLVRSDRATDGVRARLEAALPDSLTVTHPASRGARFERVIGAFQAMLDGLSLLCLLAGIFIVYNTSATAVTQRARDLAVLISVGAERGAIFGLVVLEALLIGAVASVIGIAVGLGLARVLLHLVAQSMGVIYQARFSVEDFTVTWGALAFYLGVGTISAVVAAMVPAWKASRLDPLELMKPDFREKLAITAPNRLLLLAGATIVAVSLLSIWLEHATRSVVWGNVGASLWYLAAVILSIPLMSGVCRVLQNFLPRVFGLEGRMAVESLTRSPGRTGVTTAVIGLSLTVALAVSAVALSFRESERNWFILTGDLVVSSVATEGGWLESPLSPVVGERIAAVPGVARVESYRVLQGQAFRDGRIAMVAVSPGFIDTPQFRRQFVAGDPDAAIAAVRDDTGVVVSDNLADRFGLAVGDEIVVPTPAGRTPFTVTGVVSADYSGDQGSVIVSRARLDALWGDRQVSHFNVYLAPGASVDAVRSGILAAIGDGFRVKVLTVGQTLAYHQGMVDRAFVFTYAIQLLVVAVTLAGIFDLLTTQIIERRQEIGIFRAIGADEPRIGRAIRLEALVIGLSGAVLGTLLGIVTSLLWVRVNFRILIGYILDFHFPALTAIWCMVLAGAVAVIAGQLAARRALRAPVLDSLRYE